LVLEFRWLGTIAHPVNPPGSGTPWSTRPRFERLGPYRFESPRRTTRCEHQVRFNKADFLGLESVPRQAHILAMEAFIKIALLAVLMVLTFGVIPDRRKGAVVAIGTCVVAALALHFVAP
jgi:hypothetical protein